MQCAARLVKALPGQICPTPHGFAPPYLSRAKRRPSKAEAQTGPSWRRRQTGFLPKRGPGQAAFTISDSAVTGRQPVRFSVAIYYSFSIFSIVYARTTHQQPPAGPDAGQRQPFPFWFGPLAPLPLRFEARPWGGARLSSRESLPPQKFISRVDFSFFRSLKLILFLTVSFQR